MSKIIGVCFVLAVIVLALCPWLDKKQAEKIITDAFNKRWAHVADGCGPIQAFRNTKQIPFGYISQIKYTCGLQNSDYNQIIHKEEWHSVYVSPFMTAYGDFSKAALE